MAGGSKILKTLMEIGYRVTNWNHVRVRLVPNRMFAKNVTHGQGDKVETGDQAENYNCEH